MNARLLLAVTLILALPLVQAAPVDASLTRDIQTAQAKLERTQTRIGTERTELARSLNELENQAVALRSRAAAAQRLADEATLSLQQLQNRLQTWRQQQAFQNNQLHRFLREFDTAGDAPSGADALARAIQIAEASLAEQTPAWREAELVQADGRVRVLPTLRLGPSTWYWDPVSETGGEAKIIDGLLQTSLAFSGAESRQVQALYERGAGPIALDPSNRASRLVAAHEGPIEHIGKGGLWAIPIVVFGLFALAIALAKAWQLWRLPKVRTLSARQLQAAFKREHGAPSLSGYQNALLTIARDTPHPRVRDDRLFAALSDTHHHLGRWLGAIAVTASVSPLLGLLGTVSGMIETFKMMTLFGAGDPQVVSGGISQALITTELGLVVAIPALILNALLSRRAKQYYAALESFALQLSDDQVTPVTTKPASLGNTPTKEAVAL